MNALLSRWLPFAVVSTVLCGFVHAAVQREMRGAADDLPAQIAQDIAVRLEAGMPASSAVGGMNIDPSRSLAPFVVIFGSGGNAILASSVVLHDKAPVIPRGVLEHAVAAGENRVTWEPEPGARSAIVAVATKGKAPSIVVAGHSLREVEKRERNLTTLTLVAWALSLGGSFAAVWFAERRR